MIIESKGMRAAMIRGFLVVCLLLSALPSPALGVGEDEKRDCLKCHGEKGSVKRFGDGDFVSTYVDSKALDMSVHRSLRCTECHNDFSLERHPDRSFGNKLQYRIRESGECRGCHSVSKSESHPACDTVFRKDGTGEAVVCADCHSAHAIAAVSGGRLSTSEERYCLGCHAYENRMAFKSGDSISARVHVSEIRNSAHKNVSCSDCHFGFSSEDHPKRRFRSEREYRISTSDICRRCHFDKYSKVTESIHYALLSAGRLEAPTCVDCHGGHAVSSPGKSRLSVVQNCRTCHAGIYEAYSRSVHGKALFEENNKDVPICIDCHSSHNIKDPTTADFRDYIPDICSKCHSDAALMRRYGLSTEVVKTYLSDFHGVTLSLYRKEGEKGFRPDRMMAVCTDCHGIHDIAGISGSDTQTLKRNLQKRCRTCHINATENFPDSWISHYKPSLKVAPMVFIVEEFYRIMMPLMVAGLLFQVFLQIWRYLVSR